MKGLSPHAERTSSDLRDRPVGGRFPAQKQGDADDAIIPGEAHLSSRPVLGCIEQRNDGCCWEVDVFRACTGFIDHMAQRNTRILQHWQEKRTLFCGKPAYQMIL